MNGQECSSTSEKKIAYFDRKMMILNFLMCCQFTDFKAYFPLKNSQNQEQNGHAKKKRNGVSCRNVCPVYPCIKLAFRALNHKLLNC